MQRNNLCQSQFYSSRMEQFKYTPVYMHNIRLLHGIQHIMYTSKRPSRKSATWSKTIHLNLSENRFAMKILVSRNLSTQFAMHVSVFPSILLLGLSTHFSKHISVKAWIWLWNLCFCSSTNSSSSSFFIYFGVIRRSKRHSESIKLNFLTAVD